MHHQTPWAKTEHASQQRVHEHTAYGFCLQGRRAQTGKEVGESTHRKGARDEGLGEILCKSSDLCRGVGLDVICDQHALAGASLQLHQVAAS